jgi:CRISPR-associated protein Cas2
MAKRSLWIAAYDVSDTRRLRDALNIVTAFSSGGQKSCHEAWLTPAEVNALEDQLVDSLNPDEDRWGLFPIGPRPITRALGIARPPIDAPALFFGWEPTK